MNCKSRVGIPRALSYYTFYPLWRTFIEKLGAEVILSRRTNRSILEEGIRETVNDACIPIKIYHGHVLDLIGRVDYIFTPRLISEDGRATFCPKFLGLPDMVRYSGAKIPALIDVRYNRSVLSGGLPRFFYSVALSLGVRNPFLVFYAASSAINRQRRYWKLLARGVRPPEAIEAVFSRDSLSAGPVPAGSATVSSERGAVIALLGYPYAIYDSFVSAGIYDKLLKLGVEVITYEQIPARQMRRAAKVLPQNFFWHYSNQVCWAGLSLLRGKSKVDGLIHITAFGCGPDAMVDKTMELEAKAAGVPFLNLIIDEHTGEGGVQTRLEAFVDMLWARKITSRAV